MPQQLGSGTEGAIAPALLTHTSPHRSQLPPAWSPCHGEDTRGVLTAKSGGKFAVLVLAALSATLATVSTLRLLNCSPSSLGAPAVS